jgi:hypothetical protein
MTPPLALHDGLLAPGASLEACDEQAVSPGSQPYCPAELLGSFALLMAGHGRCVSTAMMLGDREYALWQIGCARTMDDPELAALATRLFAYYA